LGRSPRTSGRPPRGLERAPRVSRVQKSRPTVEPTQNLAHQVSLLTVAPVAEGVRGAGPESQNHNLYPPLRKVFGARDRRAKTVMCTSSLLCALWGNHNSWVSFKLDERFEKSKIQALDHRWVQNSVLRAGLRPLQQPTF
jgi:hypothetical protein